MESSSSTVLTIPVAPGAEGGLLGIAASPSFTLDRLFYVYTTVSVGGARINRVVRYRLDADHHAATLDRIILDHLPGAEHHDGGRLRFGPDGMLYVGTGDARVPAIAQSKESLVPLFRSLNMFLRPGLRAVRPFEGLVGLVVPVHGRTSPVPGRGGSRSRHGQIYDERN